ncbi:MAG: hypothetical protein PHI49_04160 [Halothiobacillaceae bacterium]|nr:hypothetical protein [Halothiobacillaceae bacterium]MDY0049179.1 hypothetical protein [Halothiobacillaceae bacterium]
MSLIHHEHDEAPSGEVKIISARSSRRASSLFNYGNIIVTTLAGIPLMLVSGTAGKGLIFATVIAVIPLVLWFGGSMLLYALNRHHPNPKVGHYTQWAAYRYYGVVGSLVVIGTFFPSEILYYRIFWVFAFLIIVPWSILDLIRIQRDEWRDISYVSGHHGA